MIQTDSDIMIDVGEVADLYEAAYQEHGRSLSAIFIPKGRQKERFDALTRPITGEGFTILDYGCGFGHLKDYLDQKFTQYHYTGVDITASFIQDNIARFSGQKNSLFQQIASYKDVQGQYDYILSAGVFNLRYSNNPTLNKQFVYDSITHLFHCANTALLIDFMPADVDYMQESAYHQDVMEIYDFFRKNLTRRLILDQSYMPYEYCLIAFKDQDILQPDNIYREIGIFGLPGS